MDPMVNMNNHTDYDQDRSHEKTAVVENWVENDLTNADGCDGEVPVVVINSMEYDLGNSYIRGVHKLENNVKNELGSTNISVEGVTSVDNDLGLSSTDVSDEEVVESSDTDYDPGGYTKLVVGKWEKQGYIPTAINRASSISSRTVHQRANRKCSQNTESVLNIRTEVSNKDHLNAGAMSGRKSRGKKAKLTSQHIMTSEKTSTQHGSTSSDNSLSVDGSNSNVNELVSHCTNSGFLTDDESLSKLDAGDQSITTEECVLKCNKVSETDIGIFDSSVDYSRLNTLSNIDISKIKKEEIAQSAMQYYGNVQAGVNALPQNSELEKPEGRKTKRKRYDTSSKVIDGKKWRECTKCAKLFSTLKELKEHRKTHRNDPISEPDLVIIDGKRWRECSICKKRFSERRKLTLHIRVHTREKPHECSVCGKRFRQLSSMGSHMRIHSGEKPHTCDTCGMNFSERSALKLHIRRHLGMRSFRCTICPKTYYTSTHLKVHMNSHLIKSGEMEKFACSLCNKAYSNQEVLKAHLKSHDPEKQIKCPECNLVVLTKYHLNRHLKTHKDDTERSFLCGLCGKSYFSQNKLTQHMHKHTQEYQCDKCTLSFSKECFLKAHRGIHDRQDNEPTHECPHCDDKFIFIYELKQHVKKTHRLSSQPEICLNDSNEKLYACSHCPKTYTTWRGQWKHAKKHHPAEHTEELQNDGSV